MTAVIKPIVYEEASSEVRAEYERQYRTNGTVTNAKKTLLHHLPSYRAYEEWHRLREALLKFVSHRAFAVFCYAISLEGGCALNAAAYRKTLTDRGENPDELLLDDEEQALERYGRRLASAPNDVPAALFAHLSQYYSPEQIVALTAFAGQMIALNVFVSALRVELDEYLLHFTS
ncbi:carboxymuconolactone decarboxylase family protein [Paenibacillaceae bacterium WGS1546]|uniref:carboxymuconolactone decarboxylase family protein n=1 Tax=Cohnella sp. WGS1546 TaxID=3366810 RepID=UPI00372D81D8